MEIGDIYSTSDFTFVAQVKNYVITVTKNELQGW